MSKTALDVLSRELGVRLLETTNFRGDEVAIVRPEDWKFTARLLRDHAELEMNHFTDITAVDYPEREPDLPRFDVLLLLQSLTKGHRLRIKTRVAENQEIDTLSDLWAGANWGEREVFDMFGIRFRGHPDLRRILLYEEFVGFPLRKDYPIGKTQPLVPYRDADDIEKIAPFGETEGMPFGRVDWHDRLGGGNLQVSPAIALQQRQHKMLSQSEAVLPTEQLPPPTATGPDAKR